ncbi:MAG: outer membrane beta-barrel protein [bacterium]|nr:outer membrane beta-barrel protein [bacterium]
MRGIRMSRVLRLLVVFVVLVLSPSLVVAQEVDEHEDESLYDHTGWFLRAGAALATFDEKKSDIQFDVGVGVAVAAGYRPRSYVAGELSFAYFWKSDTDDFLEFPRLADEEDDPTKKLVSYEISVNAKGYPLGYFASEDLPALLDPVAEFLDVIPDFFQPYLSLGVGYSEQNVGKLDQTRFALRFVGGADFLVTKHLGAYVEGGYTMHRDVVRRKRGSYLDGTRHMSVGALVRF